MSTPRLLAAGTLASVALTVVALAMTITATASTSAARPAQGSAKAAAHGATAGSCDSLTSLALPGVKITAAQTVPAGTFSVPAAARQNPSFKQLPEFCRVVATLEPSSDSHIGMELWLPTQNWNGKFLAVGNGGWAGNIVINDIAAGLSKGYAAASNDTGHQDAGAAFATHPEKVIDFGYRAMHEMTVRSKAIVQAFYNRAPQLSYYQGCSTGGRQGLMEAQRYPDDFDAIVVGAPVNNQVRLNVSQTALQVEMLKDPSRIVPPGKVTLFANAVMAACDANDGVKDNIISNPLACKFDPGTLLCKAGDAADCLTAPQVASARQLYSPVKSKKGESVYPGRMPGVEAGWTARIPTAGAPMNPLWGDMPRYVGHRDANWDVMSFDLDTDLALTLKNASFIESTDPNLAKFKLRGGKLLLWHGWADPGPSPQNTINYYSDVAKTLGGKQDDWMRMFFLPGVGHCGGGVGPDQADFFGALERWRETGTAPDQIIASRNPGRGGLSPMTRPLCPFPQVAKYKGTGSTDDASNFVCAAP